LTKFREKHNNNIYIIK